jgi:peptidyl-prolyl cis-trans isomerase C
MFARIKLLTAFVLAAGISLAIPAQAEVPLKADTVMATVNGTEITLGHMIALRKSLPQQYDQIPAKVLYDGILEQLIQQTLLMQSYKDELSLQYKLTIENERRGVFARAAIERVMKQPISDEELQKSYEEQYVKADQKTEYSAAHILVDTEDEAKALIEELNKGADFATLAKEKSKGPSGANGGDLGWFSEGMMVEPFFDAVAKLKPGEISPPVQSEFGWHVVLLKETRSMARPKLDEVRSEIEGELRKAAFDSFVENLTNSAEIDQPEYEGLDPAIINKFELLEQ